MRRRLIAVVIASVVLAGGVLATGGAPAGADDPPRAPAFAAGFVRLDGAQEVPPADPDGRGTFAFVAVHDKLCYALTARRIEPARMAHIHVGVRGANGGIVVGLIPPTNGFSADCIQAQPGATDAMALTPEELAAIIADPAGFYVNVHNDPFPAGAIRGQLR